MIRRPALHVRITRRAVGRGMRKTCVLALLGAVAIVAYADTATTTANTVSFTGSVPISVISITVSPTTSTFGKCAGGSSTTGTLGFPDGQCESPAIKVSESGGTTRVDGSASNASAADGGTGWSLCVPFAVAGTPECENDSDSRLRAGSAPGPNQFALEDDVSGGLGVGFIPSSGSCLPGFISARSFNCDDLSSAHSSEQMVLTVHGPELSNDDSSPFSVTVTFTAVPGT